MAPFTTTYPDGFWNEAAAPDPVWLTVLVLDALQLTEGKKLTFRWNAPVSDAPLVFVAYQHDDTKWLEEIRKHLGHLVHSGKIEFFDDRKIDVGEWDPAIKQKLNSAKIIVPLLSKNFLGSAYIQKTEFPTAMRRYIKGGVEVIPILIGECDWEGLEWDGFSLHQLAILPKDDKNNLKPLADWGRKKDVALTQVAKRIRKLVENSSKT